MIIIFREATQTGAMIEESEDEESFDEESPGFDVRPGVKKKLTQEDVEDAKEDQPFICHKYWHWLKCIACQIVKLNRAINNSLWKKLLWDQHSI